MSDNKCVSIWVLEILRKDEWVRYCDKTYTDPEKISVMYSSVRRTMIEHGTKLRIAEYRGFDFTEPYTTIP